MARERRVTKLERNIENIFDLRTNFGKGILKLAGKLKGPRAVALTELLVRLREKGIERLSQPIKFKFAGFEKGEKYERIATSLSAQRLRYAWKYSISYAETRAGYREDIGHLGILGEIEIGRKLKRWFPNLAVILGDKSREEFLKPEGLRKRTEELGITARKTIEDILNEELSKTGYDVSELKDYLKEFFISAALQQRGSDLYWLKRQINSGKIADENLAKALISVMEEPDYSKDDAILVGKSIMELRKKPAKGLIGSLIDDLRFLDSDRGRKEQIYDANLDIPFIRRQFYPDKRQIEQGKIRETLKKDSMSFAEALGIARAFPGIAEARKNFNRKNALKYFSGAQNIQDADACAQQAVANLNNAVESIAPYLERDRKEWHEAKKSGRKADLFLKTNYGLVKEIDETRRLDREKGSWANLIRWIKMKDSKRIFSGLYIIGQQIQLAGAHEGGETYAPEGIMSVTYENQLDFEEWAGIDLQETIKRISSIDMKKPTAEDRQRASKAKTSIKTYKKFREKNLERISKEAEFNLVQPKIAKDLAKFYNFAKEYTKAEGGSKEKIDFLLSLERCCGLKTYGYYPPINNLARAYTSAEEKAMAEMVYNKIMQNKDLKQLAEAAKQGGVENARIFKELEEKRQKIDKRKQARIYHSGEAILEPSWKFIKPAPTFLARRISLIEPAKIIEAANRLEDAAAGRELGNEFIRKLRVIEKNVTSGDVLETDSRIKVRKKYLGCLISDLDEDAGSILISKELASQIERIYGAVKNYEMREIQNQFSRYEDVVEKGSIAKLTEGRFYDISAYSKDRKDPQGFLISAFSKRRGGIGFLRWAQDKGWYAEGMARGRLMDLIGQLKARQTNVKLRIERVY